MSTESIQTVKTFYGGAMSQEDKTNPQEIRKVGFFGRTVCGKNDSIDYSTTDSQNSDIAAMSDFSDDEDGPQGEVRPQILTECVSDDSVREESNDRDRPVPDMIGETVIDCRPSLLPVSIPLSGLSRRRFQVRGIVFLIYPQRRQASRS